MPVVALDYEALEHNCDPVYKTKINQHVYDRGTPSHHRASITNRQTFNSSLGTTIPHPLSQWTGFLGLCSHSCMCADSMSNLTTAVQP